MRYLNIRTCCIALTAILAWANCFAQLMAECITDRTWCSQPPDRGSNGLDVLDGLRAYLPCSLGLNYLADDFLCTQSGAITNIQIWGSYWNDNRLKRNPPLFNLAIFNNVPADENVPYSRPGELVWSWYGTAIEQLDGWVNERFYDPKANKILGYDRQIWKYDFSILVDGSFFQELGEKYWLGVCRSADLQGDGKVNYKDLLLLVCDYPWGFGWKTSSDESLNDAVFTSLPLILPSSGIVVPPPTAEWSALRYPQCHPLARQGIDLAFSIGSKPVPEPSVIIMLAGLGIIFLLRYGRPFIT